jgi:hypothetical protein
MALVSKSEEKLLLVAQTENTITLVVQIFTENIFGSIKCFTFILPLPVYV